MILGIGTDLCDIRRIEASLARFGDRFRFRVFTGLERARALRRAGGEAHSLAMSFAAKEACAKALGTGFRQGVALSAIGVAHLPSGKPTLYLSRGAASRLTELTPAGMKPMLDVSLTDEYPMAHAMVIISAVTEAV